MSKLNEMTRAELIEHMEKLAGALNEVSGIKYLTYIQKVQLSNEIKVGYELARKQLSNVCQFDLENIDYLIQAVANGAIATQYEDAVLDCLLIQRGEIVKDQSRNFLPYYKEED